MSVLGKIFSAGLGNVIKEVGNVADKFHVSGEEKQQFILEMETILQKRDAEIQQTLRAELAAKQAVIVAELSQGDTYTKRARPTVIYYGLYFIAFNYCLIPMALLIGGVEPKPLALPVEFWAAWTGIASAWVVGRSFERRGVKNKIVQGITGSPKISLLD
jgi:hypothetical protein